MDASRERIRTCLEAFCFDFLDDLGNVRVSYCRNAFLGSTLPNTPRKKLLPVKLELLMTRQITLFLLLLHALLVLLQSLFETLTHRAQRFEAMLTEAGLHL